MIASEVVNRIKATVDLAEVVQETGVTLRRSGKRLVGCCPFHTENNASFTVYPDGAFWCFGCSQGGDVIQFIMERDGIGFLEAVDLLSEHRGGGFAAGAAAQPWSNESEGPRFTSRDARGVWATALERIRRDELDVIVQDRDVYDYLAGRGLGDAYEHGLFGILAEGTKLPPALFHQGRSWVETGHRLISPLYNQFGEIVSLQCRSVRGTEPKTLTPAGSRVAGTLFGTELGVRVLRGTWSGARTVILLEGMTDLLAVGPLTDRPVLSVPGVGSAASIGAWVQGFRLLIGFDADRAGDGSVEQVARAATQHGARAVHRLRWPAKDPAEVLARFGADALLDAMDEAVALCEAT